MDILSLGQKIINASDKVFQLSVKKVILKTGEKLLKRAKMSNKNLKTESVSFLKEDVGSVLFGLGLLITITIIAIFMQVRPEIRQYVDNTKKLLLMEITKELSKLKLDITKETKEFILFYSMTYALYKVTLLIRDEINHGKLGYRDELYKYLKLSEVRYTKKKTALLSQAILESLNEIKAQAESDFTIFNKITIAESAITDQFVIKFVRKFFEDLINIAKEISK